MLSRSPLEKDSEMHICIFLTKPKLQFLSKYHLHILSYCHYIKLIHVFTGIFASESISLSTNFFIELT